MKRTNLRLTYANEIRREIQRRYKRGEKPTALMKEFGLTWSTWWNIRDGNPGVPFVRCDFESLYRKMGRPRAK